MQNMKHVGRVANTGLKCVVVFREIYDENGNVTDPNNCLIVETERLPDMEHDDMVRVVESDTAQDNPDFYHVAQRNKFSDGTNMLVKLSKMGYLKKYPTNQIELTPNSSTAVKLSDVISVIRKQATGMSDADIANARITFENDCVCNLSSSRISSKVERKMRVFQRNAYFSIDYNDNTIDIYKKTAGKKLSSIRKKTINYEKNGK